MRDATAYVRKSTDVRGRRAARRPALHPVSSRRGVGSRRRDSAALLQSRSYTCPTIRAGDIAGHRARKFRKELREMSGSRGHPYTRCSSYFDYRPRYLAPRNRTAKPRGEGRRRSKRIISDPFVYHRRALTTLPDRYREEISRINYVGRLKIMLSFSRDHLS